MPSHEVEPWLTKNIGEALTVQGGLTYPSPQFATVCHTPEGLVDAPQNCLIVTRFNNGTLMVNYWDESKDATSPTNSKWSASLGPTMLGKNLTNFTAIAMPALEDLHFYGLTPDGIIHSYTIDRENPFSWTYEGEVNTALGG
jgi:hypothetical protein